MVLLYSRLLNAFLANFTLCFEVIRISKQLTCQKFIFKIHSSRLRNSRWALSLPLEEARINEEVIALADSTILRWIDELNGVEDADEKAKDIKREIRQIRREENSPQNKRRVKELYQRLDELQFKPDYMCLIIDKEKDYRRACRGFSINGIRYKRLLGTNGGVKNSTIVFVSERLWDTLSKRIENGRNMQKKLVTAKLEAYKALACSASTPVSMPRGVLVVDDAKTSFMSDYTYLTDENDGEPYIEDRHNTEVQLNASDGFGVMLPTLAARWSAELGLDYIVAGLNTRFSFEKGMVFTFDFLEFAEEIAGTYIVRDAWGNDIDIRNVELILTTSMVKLWSSYESCDDYINKSIDNKYTFCVTKTCPGFLENERCLNYQYIQSFDLDDDDIDELIAPTMNEIHDVLRGDWRKTIAYLKGSDLNDKNVASMRDDYIKAIMIDPNILNDTYVKNAVYQLIRNRINEAKIGVIKVHGNYSIVSGDPYLLCQSIFGLKKTGLLAAGEIYNAYWSRQAADRLVCFRAPMTTHENIVSVRPNKTDDAYRWYQYMDTCTILNGWDTATAALNGCDFDGDLVMLTDNPVLLRKHIPSPALMCAQRRAEERISTEEDFIQANIDSFGNEIGKITNRITSMYEIRTGYNPSSEEYQILSYRIRCGQLFQQNAIDKAKGIISKPMPREWYDRHAVNKIDSEEKRNLYRSIVADKKPYFMRYIYPQLMTSYKTYIKNTDRNALREFGMTVAELIAIPDTNKTDRQKEFLSYYEYRMPVGIGNCVMNKICRRFEDMFDGFSSKTPSDTYDYTTMKSGTEYSQRQYDMIKKLYTEYNQRLRSYAALAEYERLDDGDTAAALSVMNDEFRRECDRVCTDRDTLCDIILDICYSKNTTKRFAWSMCGSEMIQNLLKKNSNLIQYPAKTDDGEFSFGGNTYTIKSLDLEEYYVDCTE